MKKFIAGFILFTLFYSFCFTQEAEPSEHPHTVITENYLSEEEIFIKPLSEQTENDVIYEEISEEPLDELSDNLSEILETETTDDETEKSVDTQTKELPSEESLETAIEHKPLTLPLDDRPEIEKFRQMYLNPQWTQVLRDALENGIDYRLYVRKALQDAELPPELEYLPIVESNYKPNAKSKSNAIGLWQFMLNSVSPYLTVNDYVDERLDPWKETDAALKKLKENYNYFGDWLIAIGAYNCGTGAMSRALAKAKEKNFWYLCDHNLIPEQTQLYVPKILAIADLANNTDYYEIDIPDHQEEYESLYNEKNGIFDYVTVSKAYSLNVLAQNLRLDSSEIKKLNPSFFLGFTHPSYKSEIRLPTGTKEIAQAALETMEPIDFPVKYTVVKGDSLWSISRRYGCTVNQICELNGIKENAILKIGKILYIPSK